MSPSRYHSDFLAKRAAVRRIAELGARGEQDMALVERLGDIANKVVIWKASYRIQSADKRDLSQTVFRDAG
jgi:hypothetical protein